MITTTTPAHHGPDPVYGYVAPGRVVVEVAGREWPSMPEACVAGDMDTEWVAEGAVLVCVGCGLDVT